MAYAAASGLDKYVDIRYLEPENSIFRRTEGGFVSLSIISSPEESYERVNLIKAFPFSNENEYISVRDPEGKEIGILKDLETFPPEIVEVFTEEIRRRYFSPAVLKINSIKAEYGYTYWDVMTDSGHIRFTVKDEQQNILNISESRILIIDIYGNRFEIPDIKKLEASSAKKLDAII